MTGWIKLHRQIMENEIYFSERFTRAGAWLDLLLLANHRPATLFIRGIEINLAPGELCYSQVSLAKRWKWNRKTVTKFLYWLQKRQMIHNRISRVTTVVTIQNWGAYQNDGQQNGQQKDNRTDTNKNVENVKKHHEGVVNLESEKPEATATAKTVATEKILFDCEFFTITEGQINEWKTTYPRIAASTKFLPHIQQVADVLRNKKAAGEKIGNALAFLHGHLRRENQKPIQGNSTVGRKYAFGPSKYPTLDGPRLGKTMSLGELLAIIPADPSNEPLETIHNKGIL